MADGEDRFDEATADAGDGLVPDPNVEPFRQLCMSAFAEACVVRRRVDRGWPMLRRRLKGKHVTDEWVGRRIMLNHAYDMLAPPNQDALAHALELATRCIDYAFFRRDLPPSQVNLAVLRIERQRQERQERADAAMRHPVAMVADILRRDRGNDADAGADGDSEESS